PPNAFDLSELLSSSLLDEPSFAESSFVSSVYANQPTYTAQTKSEPVTNQAFIEFIDALCLLRPQDNSVSNLEWAVAHDTLPIPLPSEIIAASTDDGGLVHRYRDASGKWTRHPARIRPCRIEV